MARLATHLLIGALLRRVQTEGGFGAVLRKGDENSGTILIELRNRSENLGYIERVTDGSGRFILTPVGTSYSDDIFAMAQYIERRLRNDPDLWLLELDVADPERLVAEILL